MDVNQRKKIRELKARERKKATASDGLGRESLEESLLANAELGVSLGSGRLLSGDETSALPSPQPTSRRVNFSGDPFAAGTSSEPVPSPFEAQAVPSQRSGKDLWGVARRNRSHIAEMGEGANGRAIDREQSAPNIVGSLMFKLQNQRLKKALEGVAAEQREPSLTPASTAQDAEEESPGMFAPLSDLSHLGSMLLSSYLNVLLLAIPVGLTAGALGANPTLVFVANFLALLPLALILGEITEDLALRFGDAVGGLLNATFGNVVEMILGLAALNRGLYEVVAASLIGSILSNLLLVLGCCFLFGGLRHKHQRFNALANKVSASMLFLACISIVTPTLARGVYGDKIITDGTLRSLSHAIALLLIALYVCYLYFQLKTHADSFAGGSDPGVSSTYASATDLVALQQQGAPRSAADGAPGGAESRPDSPAEDHHHHPTLSLSGALGTLTVITLLVAASSEYLTGALESVSSTFHINQAFLGLIVLPIAGNAAEHITAVFVAVKNKMDLAISVALGSSIQIAVFVLPVTVLAGWVMGKELTLNLDPFAVAMLTLSVVLTYFVSSDGLSNWLLGLQLVLTYVLIGSVYLLEKEAPAAPGMGGSFG